VVQVVKFPGIGLEQVNDDFVEIEQNPPAAGVTLRGAAVAPEFQFFLYLVGDRLGLGAVRGGHDDKIIGDADEVSDREYRNVFALFAEGRFSTDLGKIEGSCPGIDEIQFLLNIYNRISTDSIVFSTSLVFWQAWSLDLFWGQISNKSQRNLND